MSMFSLSGHRLSMDFCVSRLAASQSTSYMQSLSLQEEQAVAYNPLLEFIIVFFMQPALKNRDLRAN